MVADDISAGIGGQGLGGMTGSAGGMVGSRGGVGE